MKRQPTQVKVGQVWKDRDIRSTVDEFTVIAVEGTDAVVVRVGYSKGSRRTRIRVERLLAPLPKTGASGYEYVGMKR